jgi:hypothetical protein
VTKSKIDEETFSALTARRASLARNAKTSHARPFGVVRRQLPAGGKAAFDFAIFRVGRQGEGDSAATFGAALMGAEFGAGSKAAVVADSANVWLRPSKAQVEPQKLLNGWGLFICGNLRAVAGRSRQYRIGRPNGKFNLFRKLVSQSATGRV